MPKINQHHVIYSPQTDKVALVEVTSTDGKPSATQKRDITNEFIYAMRDWTVRGSSTYLKAPGLLNRFRNWFVTRVLGKPYLAVGATSRFFEEKDTGIRYHISVVSTGIRPVAGEVEKPLNLGGEEVDS